MYTYIHASACSGGLWYYPPWKPSASVTSLLLLSFCTCTASVLHPYLSSLLIPVRLDTLDEVTTSLGMCNTHPPSAVKPLFLQIKQTIRHENNTPHSVPCIATESNFHICPPYSPAFFLNSDDTLPPNRTIWGTSSFALNGCFPNVALS